LGFWESAAFSEYLIFCDDPRFVSSFKNLTRCPCCPSEDMQIFGNRKLQTAYIEYLDTINKQELTIHEEKEEPKCVTQ
jgi:hypothetical protein